MRVTVMLLVAAVCGGCSTAGTGRAQLFPRGPEELEVVTSARPYLLPPVYQMAAAYCARSGKSAVLSAIHKAPFGSLVHTYRCDPPATPGL